MIVSRWSRSALAAVQMAVALLLVIALGACSATADDRLVIHTDTGDYTFTVEVVDTPETRQYGLMFRTELAADRGMLFDFFVEEETAFWMQNTLIPLDMIFISKDGIVRHFHENAIPRDTTSIPSVYPVQFVLEIPGGRAKEIGLKDGDKIDHPRMVAGN